MKIKIAEVVALLLNLVGTILLARDVLDNSPTTWADIANKSDKSLAFIKSGWVGVILIAISTIIQIIRDNFQACIMYV